MKKSFLRSLLLMTGSSCAMCQMNSGEFSASFFNLNSNEWTTLVLVIAVCLLVLLLLLLVCCLICRKKGSKKPLTENNSIDLAPTNYHAAKSRPNKLMKGGQKHEILVESGETTINRQSYNQSTHEIDFYNPTSPKIKSLSHMFEMDSDAPKQCMVCSVRARKAIFYNCNHICCCEPCANKLLTSDPRCPLCREGICGMDVVQANNPKA